MASSPTVSTGVESYGTCVGASVGGVLCTCVGASVGGVLCTCVGASVGVLSVVYMKVEGSSLTLLQCEYRPLSLSLTASLPSSPLPSDGHARPPLSLQISLRR